MDYVLLSQANNIDCYREARHFRQPTLRRRSNSALLVRWLYIGSYLNHSIRGFREGVGIVRGGGIQSVLLLDTTIRRWGLWLRTVTIKITFEANRYMGLSVLHMLISILNYHRWSLGINGSSY